MDKKDNKQVVKELREAQPKLQASAIARELGISRERVRQILEALGLPTSFPSPLRVCVNDGCDNELPRRSKAKTCSPECFYAYRRTTFICAYCGAEKEILKSRLAVQQKKYKFTYCSKPCRGHGLWVNARNKNAIIA